MKSTKSGNSSQKRKGKTLQVYQSPEVAAFIAEKAQEIGVSQSELMRNLCEVGLKKQYKVSVVLGKIIAPTS